GELAAEAEAERRELAHAFGAAAQRLDRRGDVSDPLLGIEFLVERKRFLALGLALPELNAGRQSPEEVGAEDDIAFLGIGIGDVAHRCVDAENLLKEDDAGATPALRDGKIGAK